MTAAWSKLVVLSGLSSTQFLLSLDFHSKITRFLLDWAWGRVAAIKEQIDRHTLPLFDFSLLEVEGGSRGELASLAGRINLSFKI